MLVNWCLSKITYNEKLGKFERVVEFTVEGMYYTSW